MFVFQLPIHTNLAHAVIWAWVITSFFVHCITPNCYQMIKKCFIIIILQIAVFYKKFQREEAVTIHVQNYDIFLHMFHIGNQLLTGHLPLATLCHF